MSSLRDRYADRIVGQVSCFDRVLLQGTLTDIGYANAMERYLRARKIRLFDYPQFAQPFRDEIRANAESLAEDNGLEIEFIRRKNFRKEERIKEIVAERGDHPGLVHIFSAMERCSTFKPWHDKQTHVTSLRYNEAKCLHYYFYFIDKDLGLCHMRVPTWAPFRLQFYFNEHNRLARQLDKKGIGYTLVENAFVDIDDFQKAQRAADSFRVDRLHRKLNRYAKTFCPVLRHFRSGYHWSLTQVEYATDIVFRDQSDLKEIYDNLVRKAVHCVKADNIATFLGRKLHGAYKGEMGNNFQTRIQGTRIKHVMDKVSLKMYDKFGFILRIETTCNDVSFFKHYRKVEHRDGASEMKYAAMKKSIYSMSDLRKLLHAANARYIAFLGDLDDPANGVKNLRKLAEPIRDKKRSFRGFNLFREIDLRIFEAIVRGEFTISGLTNRRMRKVLPEYTGAQFSRILKRLRMHGLIKKIGHTYKYYITRLGRQVATTALVLREMFVVPSLANQHVT